MPSNLYKTGTISVSAASTSVTGSGTAWATAEIQPGDEFRPEGAAATGIIASVESDTALTLEQPWAGSTISGGAYAIFRTSYKYSATGQVNQFALDMLAQIRDASILYYVADGDPDPSLGEDGHYALSLQQSKFWVKDSGIWDEQVPLLTGTGVTGRQNLGLAYTGTVVGRLARFTDTVGSQGQTTGLFENGSGQVGIGNTNPGYRLDITGDAQISATLRLAATTESSIGVVLKGGTRFIHDYRAPSSNGSNVFIGTNAGNFTMAWDGVNSYKASYNVGIGTNALSALTTGYSNVCIGLNAGAANTAGFSNVFLGYGSGNYNTSGYVNTAIGQSSLSNNTTGLANTAIGSAALLDLNITNSIDGYNTTIGYNTGRGITTGKNNTIVGANVTGLASALTGNIILADGTGAVKLQYDGTSWAVTGGFGRGAPVTKTNDFTLAATENWVICNKAGTTTVTLPAASGAPGREVTIKTIQAQTVVSASSNVVPLAGGAAGTAILAATAGKWATLVSDGTNWVIMAGN